MIARLREEKGMKGNNEKVRERKEKVKGMKEEVRRMEEGS